MIAPKFLSEKQKLFCREYILDLNASQAAIRAGYSSKCAKEQGYRLLTYAHIQEELAELMKSREARLEITADFVLQTIVNTIQRCSQSQPVYDRTGNQMYGIDPHTGEERPLFKFDGTSVLRGAELLGRHLRLFSDRIEHAGPNNGPIELITVDTSPEEAAALYRRMIEQ
tara:strand:- start:148 stop:657 length:510 start_codon:yes stop_codon:yes gene_type:complete